MIRAAGILIVEPGGTALFLKRRLCATLPMAG
jgi:hypothetical protein